MFQLHDWCLPWSEETIKLKWKWKCCSSQYSCCCSWMCAYAGAVFPAAWLMSALWWKDHSSSGESEIVVVHSIYVVVRGCVAYAGAVFQLHHRCLFRGEEITEAQVKVKVLLFIVYTLLFVDVLPMLEQFWSCITDVCSVVKRLYWSSDESVKAVVHSLMLLFMDVLPMLEQWSSYMTKGCSVVKSSLKLR